MCPWVTWKNLPWSKGIPSCSLAECLSSHGKSSESIRKKWRIYQDLSQLNLGCAYFQDKICICMIYNYVDICIYYDHYDMICYSWRLCFTHRLMAALSYTLQQNWLRTEKKQQLVDVPYLCWFTGWYIIATSWCPLLTSWFIIPSNCSYNHHNIQWNMSYKPTQKKTNLGYHFVRY